MIAEKIAKLPIGRPSKKGKISSIYSQDEVAKQLGTTDREARANERKGVQRAF
jgi:hypothetical protein